MTVQKQSGCPSFASIISILSVLLYCVGFFRMEMELNEQKKKINALEDAMSTNEKFIQMSRSPPGTFSELFIFKITHLKLRRLPLIYWLNNVWLILNNIMKENVVHWFQQNRSEGHADQVVYPKGIKITDMQCILRRGRSS